MINVKSEYKKLKRVLLHRPGLETENIRPQDYEEFLFDDAYYLKEAVREHDIFAETLRKNGVEVVYVEDLVAETLESNPGLIDDFLKKFIKEAGHLETSVLFENLYKFFKKFDSMKKLVIKMIEGVRMSELEEGRNKTLSELENHERIWAIKPLPNIIFTRDFFSSIGNGVSINKMSTDIRARETIFPDLIFKYHPKYKTDNIFYERTFEKSIEGGDIMVLSDTDIAIGISQRTRSDSIELIANKIFTNPNTKIKSIWGISIPKGRSWMHLDTVFTQIDINKFAIFSNYEFEIFRIQKLNNHGEYKITESKYSIDKLMKKIFKLDEVILIHCGGGDPIYSEREQWNDGSNTLAIAPNEVVVYDRNHVTNKILREHGVKVHEIPSYELSRGRGGPRCMSMPLEREE